ncbi:hypothetical protein BDZ97DRAFT_176019 [Flammula alnicola]|nr:hypothetical protein BDZ97DRAFT_176019 [Flammula alnicola]
MSFLVVAEILIFISCRLLLLRSPLRRRLLLKLLPLRLQRRRSLNPSRRRNETSAPAPEAAPAAEEVKEEKKEEKKEAKATKVGRRLSARVGDFFKAKPKPEVATPAKVDEHPPKIDEPAPVAPLENPASDPAAATETKPEEPAKPVEAAPAATPVVAAAA